MASQCAHTKRAHHSQGLCKACYLKQAKNNLVDQIKTYMDGADEAERARGRGDHGIATGDNVDGSGQVVKVSSGEA